MFDRAAVGIAVANPDGYLLDSNPVYQTMLGYTREELRQKRIYDVTHPDDVDKSRVFEKQLREGVIDKYQLEKRYVRKDGRVIWGRLNVSAIRNRDGSLKYNLGVAEDITERKNVENAVRESREMLRQVMNNIPQRIFWKDTRSVYLGCNTNFALAAGVGSPNNIVGKTDYDLAWAKAESDAFRKDDREVMDHDRPKYHIIEPQRQADGTQSWLDTNKIPLHDAESNVIGILGTYEDITDRLLAEAQLKDAKAQAELYLDLMGHDFTNMNQALMGNLELMDALTESGEIDRGLIDDSIEIIKRSSRMIGDVKKLTQLQTGKVPRKDVDVSEMLATVKTRYSRVPGRLITINFTPRENCIVRAGDMLEDAFDNLVDNAIRHSAGPITIDLTIHSEQIAGCRYYRITVADTGPGIPDNLKKKLFLTLKESEERAVRRGFGLYLVRTLMDIYHGKVWVEDRVPGDPSRGAKFVILLPAVA